MLSDAFPRRIFLFSLIALVSAAALLIGATASEAATLTFSPSADAYVDASRPDTNFGGISKIRTDGSPVVRSFLRFDVQGVTGSVQKATLTLVPASSLRGAVTALEVGDNSWGERTITNATAPATGATLGSVPSAVTGTPISFDVTPAVAGNGPVSLAVASSSVTALAIWSREAGGTNVPQLVVDTDATPPPDTTPPTAPAGVTATAGDGKVAIAWNAATDDVGVAGYRVYRQNADGSWPTSATASTAAGTRTWTDTGLTDGTAYTYRVAAIDAAGNESGPSATASATPQAPPPPPSTDAQPPFPVRAAFVYPWFPESWNQSGMNPFTRYHPSAGLYDSGSTSVIQDQVQAMEYGKINVGIASWWGQGTKTDSRVSTLLSATDAMNSPFRWALYYEPEGQGDPTVAQITTDLAYIRDHYGSDPSYYRVNGRFVVFVYADGADACGMADRWAQANTLIDAYVVLKVFSGYRTCLNQPARWHQYAPALAQDSQSGNSFAISPGFWKANEATPRLARDLTRWNTNIRNMVASNAPFQLVTTFDEWGEGTSVESASEWGSTSGYGDYLDALHADGQGSPPPPPTDTTPPTAPTGLSATGGDSQVSLAWNASSDDVGVTGYRVYRQNADGTWPTTPTATTPAGTLSFIDSGRANGTSYTYRVTAIDAASNESAPSATASATPQAPPDTTAPTAPAGLTATGGDAKVSLSWNASSDDVGVTGYRVYRQNADGTWPSTPTASTASGTRTFTDSGLTNGTAYTYRVTAVDAAGNESAPSATASATPQAPPDTTAPSAPGGLTATAGDTKVTLSWNASTDDVGVAGYRIYRQNADGSWPLTSTGNTSSGTRTFTDSGLTDGTAYTYRVTAIDAAGNESAPSATASATPQAPPDTAAPSAPAGVTATAGDTKVSLSWNASTDNVGVTGYRIYRQNADGTWPLTSTGSTTSGTRTFTDSGLTNGTAYTYRVTAIDAAGNESSPSATASATPQPAPPPPPSPCGTASTPPATWQHVVWIVMENHAYNQVVGSSSAPYENTLASQCGLATNYVAITHPSLPNYIAMTSGSPQGITDDNAPSSHPLDVPSIFSQVGSGAWLSPQESMPSNCMLTSSGEYAVKHNPAAYYTNIRTDCQNYDVPLGTTPDISARYTFVTPNLCNDTHDCGVGTGDSWLQTFIPKLTSTPEYQSGSTAIFVTWDEDDMTSVNQVATFVISPTTAPGTQSATRFSHYSLLRTTEEMFGMTNFLGGAATAASMRSAFNL